MEWTPELIQYWLSHYYQLRDYELNPFEETRVFLREIYLTGSKPSLAPFEETCDLNWEFDKALKGLGDKEPEFRRLYLNGEGKDKKLFEEFCSILMEGDND